MACVDPAPTPIVIDCNNPQLDEALSAYGRWDVELTESVVAVSFSSQGDVLYFAGTPTVVGGTLRDVDASSGGTYISIEIVPDANVTEVRVTVPLTCGEKTFSAVYVLDVSGTPTEDGIVPVTRE